MRARSRLSGLRNFGLPDHVKRITKRLFRNVSGNFGVSEIFSANWAVNNPPEHNLSIKPETLFHAHTRISVESLIVNSREATLSESEARSSLVLKRPRSIPIGLFIRARMVSGKENRRSGKEDRDDRSPHVPACQVWRRDRQHHFAPSCRVLRLLLHQTRVAEEH